MTTNIPDPVVATAQAAESAKQLVTDTAVASDARAAQIVRDAIKQFFNEGKDQKRFLDTERIPFICDDIRQIKNDMRTLNKYVYIGLGVFGVLSLIAPLFWKLLTK